MATEEIGDLVKQERIGQEKLEKAREQVAALIAESKEKARKILLEAENQEFYDKLFKTKSKEVEDKKKLIEKETKKKIARIHEKSRALAVKKAASMIVEYVLGVS